MLFKDPAVEIPFLGGRRMDRETNGGALHLTVGHFSFGEVTQPIDPPVAHAIAELFLLAVEDVVRDEALESPADDGFLELALAAHLDRGVQ